MDRRSSWLLLPRPLRLLPADLVAVLVLTAAVDVAVFAPMLRETPLRIPLGLALVLFVPGYVFVAALFPEAGESPAATGAGIGESGTGGAESGPGGNRGTDSADDDGVAGPALPDETPLGLAGDRAGIDGVERVALSFGLSVAITPLLGLALNFTPWGIRLGPIMAAITGFVVVATAVAAIRRWQLPPEARFRVPYREWYAGGRAAAFEPDTRTDAWLNVALAASVLLALGAVGFAVAVPPTGERFSAVYVLTEDDEGELVADGYPAELRVGESADIVVGADNHEHRTVEYTVVALEQRVDVDGNETVVEEERELDRFEFTLAHNESWHHTHAVEPTLTGEDVRIVWLLYPDSVPEEPSTDTTEYAATIWIDVLEADGESGNASG